MKVAETVTLLLFLREVHQIVQIVKYAQCGRFITMVYVHYAHRERLLPWIRWVAVYTSVWLAVLAPKILIEVQIHPTIVRHVVQATLRMHKGQAALPVP